MIIYPLYFCVIASFSDPTQVSAGRTLLWVKDFTLDAYKNILKETKLWIGYRNTIWIVGMGEIGAFFYYFMVKALNADIDARYRKTKSVQRLCGIFTAAVALAIHLWSATLAWFTTYLGPRIGPEAALKAVTAYQDDMLIAILPMYLPMVLFIGIHFVMLLAGKTRYPRWMLVFHPVTWNVLLAVIPDIAQAMQAPVATWMSVMSQSSTNSAIVIWCIAAAIHEKKHGAYTLCG